MLILQLPNDIQQSLPLILFACLAAACLGLASSLLSLLWRRLTHGDRSASVHEPSKVVATMSKFLSPALWLSVTAVHLFGWQLCVVERSQQQLHGVSYVATLTAVLLGWHTLRSGWMMRWNRVVPLTMQLAQILGLAYCANLVGNATYTPPASLTPPGKLHVCQMARTDAGTSIRLYDREFDANELAAFYAKSDDHVASLSRFAMLRGKAEPQINCHGWVFSGKHIVKGEDVPVILRDNGYQPVDTPEPDDLVVYYDPSDVVVHTGVICGYLGDLPLVESKWGITGTYVHQVDEQPYSQEYRFYRSARAGHRLHYCDTAEPLAMSGHEPLRNF